MEQNTRPLDGASIEMTWDSLRQYLDHLSERGCTGETVGSYRRSLLKLYRFLPGDKLIGPDTLESWRGQLLRDYTVRTVNVCISAANGYLEYRGARMLQLTKQLPPPEEKQPELTREEYLRMLDRAVRDGNERAYLLTKVFACTGITVQELPLLTAEAVEVGRVNAPGSGAYPVKIPECLRAELKAYMGRRGVKTGPVFVTRRGKSLNRTAVTDSIQRLASAAHIDPGKGNPRCLRRLYLAAQEQIRLGLQSMAERAHEQLINTEQLAIGWQRKDAQSL